MMTWYVRTRGRVIGPFGEADIRTMWAARQIQGFDEVSTDRVSWQAVDGCPAFAERSAVPPSPAAPGEVVVTPPAVSAGDGDVLFAPAAASAAAPAPRRRAMSADEAKQAKKKWLLIALGLWVVSIPLWVILLYTWGVLGSGRPTDAPAKPTTPPKRTITH